MINFNASVVVFNTEFAISNNAFCVSNFGFTVSNVGFAISIIRFAEYWVLQFINGSGISDFLFTNLLTTRNVMHR